MRTPREATMSTPCAARSRTSPPCSAKPAASPKPKPSPLPENIGPDFEDLEPYQAGLSKGTANRLKDAGIATVGDLTRATAGELLRIRGIGKGSLTEIERHLEKMGLRLRQE